MRHVILHYHLFKNAGSTVDTILGRHLGARLGFVEGSDGPGGLLAPDGLAQFVRANPDLLAVSSHQACFPLPRLDGAVFHPLIFLRHPIDRVGSVYSFHRRTPEHDMAPNSVAARAHDLAGFVEHRMREGRGGIFNFQVRRLLDLPRAGSRDTLTEHDLQTAKDRLLSLPTFGLVEMFDESIDQFARAIRPSFGPLEVAHPPVNQSPDRADSLAQRLFHIEEALGSDLQARLLQENELDLALYDFATRLFSERMAATRALNTSAEESSPRQPFPW